MLLHNTDLREERHSEDLWSHIKRFKAKRIINASLAGAKTGFTDAFMKFVRDKRGTMCEAWTRRKFRGHATQRYRTNSTIKWPLPDSQSASTATATVVHLQLASPVCNVPYSPVIRERELCTDEWQIQIYKIYVFSSNISRTIKQNSFSFQNFFYVFFLINTHIFNFLYYINLNLYHRLKLARIYPKISKKIKIPCWLLLLFSFLENKVWNFLKYFLQIWYRKNYKSLSLLII